MEEKQITLQIDRHYITVPEGSTILEAARKIGIDIPTLCHIDLKALALRIIRPRAASVSWRWKDVVIWLPPVLPVVQKEWWCVPVPCV